MEQHPDLNCDIECACDALNASKAGREWMPTDDLGGRGWQRKTITPKDACELTYTVNNIVQDLW